MNEKKFRGDELLMGGLGSADSEGCFILALLAAFMGVMLILGSCEQKLTVRVEVHSADHNKAKD